MAGVLEQTLLDSLNNYYAVGFKKWNHDHVRHYSQSAVRFYDFPTSSVISKTNNNTYMYLPHTLLNSSCRPNYYYIAVCMHWQIDNSSFLSSIWDKVIAGSCMILVYVAVAMLLSMRKKILGIQTCEDVSQLLNKVWILDCCIYNSSLHTCMLYIHADLFGLMVAEHVHYVPSALNRSGHCYIVAYAYDLITLNTLVLVWSPKLNRVILGWVTVWELQVL